MKKLKVLLLSLVMVFSISSTTLAATSTSIHHSSDTPGSVRAELFKELKGMIKEGKTDKVIKPINFNSTAIDAKTGAKINIQVKQATKKIGEKKNSDGSITTSYSTLAVASYSSREGSSTETANGVTQYYWLDYDVNGHYVRLTSQEAHWSRTSSAYHNESALEYARNAGPGTNGIYTGGDDTWNIGKVSYNSWYYSPMYCPWTEYISTYEYASGYAQSDLWYTTSSSNYKVIDNWKTTYNVPRL